MKCTVKHGGNLHALPLAASGLAVAIGLAATPARAVVITTYNSGTTAPVPVSTLAAPSSFDIHYAVVSAPGGSQLSPSFVATPPLPSYWLPAGGSSGWIQPSPANTQLFGTSYLETSFNLAGLDPHSAIFSGRWATDDAVGAIYLNGQNLIAVGGSYAPSAPGTWALFGFAGSSLSPGALSPGVNTLTFEVTRTPGPVFVGPAALRVEYGGDASLLPVPEPSTYGLMALGLAGIGIARRRLAP